MVIQAITQTKFIENKVKVQILEREVNNFLKTVDSKSIIDIKYRTESNGLRTLYSAMIIYTLIGENNK